MRYPVTHGKRERNTLETELADELLKDAEQKREDSADDAVEYDV